VVVVVKVVVLVVVRCVEVVEGQGCGQSTVRTDLVTDPSPGDFFLTCPRPVVPCTRDPSRGDIPVSITSDT